MTKRIGLIGFGRIGTFIYEQSAARKEFQVEWVYDSDSSKTSILPKSVLLKDASEMVKCPLDLVVEAADYRAVTVHAPQVLKKTDMMILSATALADEKVSTDINRVAERHGTRYYIPHGALLGMDGLYDARETLEEVEILTVKHPRNIDFSFTEQWSESDIKERTVLYEGSARGVCSLFPRNVNAHAVVAISCLGFDKTQSKFIADPYSNDALQYIVAKGGGASIEVKRSSVIKGVTGDYTLASIYGSILRALGGSSGLRVV